MSSDFDPLFWFVCKICRKAFRNTEKLRKHKFRKHAEDCKNVKCIVFEGRLFDKKWVPFDNYFPVSSYEFINENAIEVAPVPYKCGCHCHSISTIPAETQTESHPPQQSNHKLNPYVLVKRLTPEELTAALNGSAEKPVFQSSPGSKEAEHINIDLNHVDVQSENENKDISKHQEDQDQDQQQDLSTDQNILVTPPEVAQNSVTPMVELDTGVLPELVVECSSIPPLSPSSGMSPTSLQNIGDAQNPEENEFPQEIRVTVSEEEIHIELLSVKGMIEMRPLSNESEAENHVYKKSKSRSRSPVSAKKQTSINVTKKLSKPNHNPYVLVNRLTLEEENAALRHNSKKIVTELFQEIVTPNKEPRRDVFSEQEQFLAISTLSDSSVNAPLDEKCDANTQSVEEIDNQLPTGTQTLEYQKQYIEEYDSSVNKTITIISTSDPTISSIVTDASALALPSLIDSSNLSRPEVNNGNEHLSKTSTTEQINTINDVSSQVELLPNKNEIEVICLAHNYECNCPSSSGVSLEVQTKRYLQPPHQHTPNPYVLVKRLTLEELNCASNRNAEKLIFASGKRKRTNILCVNHDDVQSPNRKKKHVKHHHQLNQEQEQNASAHVNPDLFPAVAVTPNPIPSCNASPEHVEFSLVSHEGDPSDDKDLPSVKCNHTGQNVEENELEKQLDNVTMQTLDSQKDEIQETIEDSNNISNLALALLSFSDFRDLNKTPVAHQFNEEHEEFSETNNPKPNTIITHVFYSDSECFQIEYPVSVEVPDGVRNTNTGEEDEQLSPISNVREINIDIESNDDISKHVPSHVPFNLQLNQEEISISDSTSQCASLNTTASNNIHPVCVADQVTESKKFGRSTQVRGKKSKITTMQYNPVDSVTNRNDEALENKGDKNDGDVVVQKDSNEDSERNALKMPCNNKKHKDHLSTSINSSQIRENAPNATDGSCSDYTADRDKNASSKNTNNDEYRKPHARSHHRLQGKKTQNRLSTPRIPHYRKPSQLHTKAENLALFRWLKTQKRVRFSDGSKNKIYLWTERFSMSKVLGLKNYIKCKLCRTKLETESKLKNHVNNCWLHNQRNHVYCIPCGRLCGSPQSLAKHFQNESFTAQHANFRRNNGSHFLDTNKPGEVDLEGNHQRQISVNDTGSGLYRSDPASTDKNLPILTWLEIQHKNPNNVVALEPDPLTSNRNFPNATFTISASSPIKCKLCLQLLTSDLLLRNHVETCWSQNKTKHRYCVPCNKYYKSVFCLRQHQRYKHKNALYQKEKQESFWTCSVCHKDMEKKFLFSAHQISLQIFLGKGSETSEGFLRKSNPGFDSTQGQYIDIPGQEGTLKNLMEWLKHIRKIPNSEGTENLVLIDPDPTTYSVGDETEISEENPITCRLCLKKLTQVEAVKNHVKMCWPQNKENHRYCLSCDKGFATPTELQEHRASEHSASKNIVLFYREDDGDGSLLNVDGLEVNSDNPVTCKLCETELTSVPEVKIHSENCWFHNKSRHVYCTICDSRFDTANKLKCHNTSRHRNSRSCRSLEDQSESETETEKLLPLEKWLQIQKENPNNVIALEPDPLASEAVSKSSPVKCKLCQELLTTESALRNHVKSCWKYNKSKHCYCIPCSQQFAANQYLLIHNRAKHLKYKAIFPTCIKCTNEFSTESELTEHTESLQEFLRQRKNCTHAAAENGYSVNASGGPITMACMFEWLKHLRQIKNLDGTENIILVDPEPTSDNFDEFNCKNPITCRLCQQKFTTLRALKFHVQNCWSQKKDMHRFCVTCEKVFETPQNLQDHSRTEHWEIASASFICKFCSQSFADVKIFEDHQEAHKDPKFLPFKCTQCTSVAFSNKKELLQHMAGLHGRLGKVAAYKCRICFKPFTTANVLNDHTRSVHTGERPFKCKFPNCSYTSYSTVIRRLHYQQKHWKECGLEAKQFLCSICGKVLTTRLGLTRHLKLVHTLEKPYKCTHEGCTKEFSTNSELTEHMRVHTGQTETPHECEECGQFFATESTFLKHTMGL